MTLPAYIVRPGAVISHTSEGKREIDGVTYFAYDRLENELNDIGDLDVTLVDRDAVPEPGEFALLDSSLGYVADLPSALRGAALLLEAERNSFLQMAELGLLGGVTAEGMQQWRNNDPSALEGSLVGRRDVAESLDAVGGNILGPRTYCYLARSDWTSLPLAVSRYLKAALG